MVRNLAGSYHIGRSKMFDISHHTFNHVEKELKVNDKVVIEIEAEKHFYNDHIIYVAQGVIRQDYGDFCDVSVFNKKNGAEMVFLVAKKNIYPIISSIRQVIAVHYFEHIDHLLVLTKDIMEQQYVQVIDLLKPNLISPECPIYLRDYQYHLLNQKLLLCTFQYDKFFATLKVIDLESKQWSKLVCNVYNDLLDNNRIPRPQYLVLRNGFAACNGITFIYWTFDNSLESLRQAFVYYFSIDEDIKQVAMELVNHNILVSGGRKLYLFDYQHLQMRIPEIPAPLFPIYTEKNPTFRFLREKDSLYIERTYDEEVTNIFLETLEKIAEDIGDKAISNYLLANEMVDQTISKLEKCLETTKKKYPSLEIKFPFDSIKQKLEQWDLTDQCSLYFDKYPQGTYIWLVNNQSKKLSSIFIYSSDYSVEEIQRYPICLQQILKFLIQTYIRRYFNRIIADYIDPAIPHDLKNRDYLLFNGVSLTLLDYSPQTNRSLSDSLVYSENIYVTCQEEEGPLKPGVPSPKENTRQRPTTINYFAKLLTKSLSQYANQTPLLLTLVIEKPYHRISIPLNYLPNRQSVYRRAKWYRNHFVTVDDWYITIVTINK